MSGNTRASYRYAKALMDLSIEQKFLEKANEDIILLNATLKSNSEVRVVLANPIVRVLKKEELLTAVFSKSLHKQTMAFLTMLVHKGRAELLMEIAHSFLVQYNEMKGIITASVVSATPLSVSASKELQKMVKDATKSNEVVFEATVNPDLIGGLILTVGDLRIDASISSKLSSMKRAFAK